MEGTITVDGLKKEKAELLASYLKAEEVFKKAQAAHKVAKDSLVDFNNGYGRVLEVLE